LRKKRVWWNCFIEKGADVMPCRFLVTIFLSAI
jgi:hypothetical protein